MSVGLLCLTGHAYANVTVTTTEDVVQDDQVCSLREAVTYVNEYLSDSKKKEAGYYGCGGKDATALIILEKDKTYTLNSEILIKQSVTIQTKIEEFTYDNKEAGLHNATIKAKGAHRLFRVDDEKSEINQIAVNFTQLNLQGCGTASEICADQGGIIFNREALIFQYVRMFDGFANQGGAIYSEGLIAGDNASSASFVTMNNSIAYNNKAKNGAVLYMAQPLFSLQNTIVRHNENTDAEGALIYSANAFDDKTTNTDTFIRVAAIRNSSLFKNKGFLVNMRDGVYVNNITAVDNTKGLYLNAPGKKAHVSNSIIAGNHGQDCQAATGDTTAFYNNLVASTALCGVGEENNRNFDLSTWGNNDSERKLFAGTDSEGKCDAAGNYGLLCPFNTPKDTFLGFFRPRLLTMYHSLNDSPIVNRGRLFSDGSDQGSYNCESTDQRGLARAEAVHCDLGAIELVVSPENINRMGKDILTTDKHPIFFDILDNLADGELWPAAQCKNVFGSDKVPNNKKWVNAGKDWEDGCLRVEQTEAVTPVSKGKLELCTNAENELKLCYTPHSAWHGLDDFSLRIMTTASRFADAEQSRDIVVPARIVQEPVDNFKSSMIKVSGGSLGVFSILGLFVLALRRRTQA